jgi:hypothetical protein
MAIRKARLEKAATRAFARLATACGYVPEAIGRQRCFVNVDAVVETLRVCGLYTEEVRCAVWTAVEASTTPPAPSVTGFETEALVHGWAPACTAHCVYRLFAQSAAEVLARYGHDPDIICKRVRAHAQHHLPSALPRLAAIPSYGCGQSCVAWSVASGEAEGESNEQSQAKN